MNWYKKALFVYAQETNSLTFYHGTTTGPNDSYLQSFLSGGIDPSKSSGFGQGNAFYCFINRKLAEHRAKSLAESSGQEDISFEYAGQLSNIPMIVKFNAPLTTDMFDLDFEFSELLSAQMMKSLNNEFKSIPDGYIQGVVRKRKFTVLPSKSEIKDFGGAINLGKDFLGMTGNVRAVIVVQFEDGDTSKINIQGNPYYPFESSSVEDAAIVGTVFSYLEKNFPDKTKEVENDIFKQVIQNKGLDWAIKYYGSPISVSASENIEVFVDNKWIDGQAYLSHQKNQQPQEAKINSSPEKADVNYEF
jgi:hypothetical protein